MGIQRNAYTSRIWKGDRFYNKGTPYGVLNFF